MIKEFKELVNAINSPDNEYRENDLDMLNYNMAAFGEYVQIVYHQNYSTPIKYATLEGEELREAIQSMDKNRRIKHEAAIAACSQINRDCEYYNVPKFCPETTDRHIIADFCAQVTAAFYLDGIGRDAKTIDDVIKAMTQNCKSVNISNITNNIDTNELSDIDLDLGGEDDEDKIMPDVIHTKINKDNREEEIR